jgi:hypothetical protein
MIDVFLHVWRMRLSDHGARTLAIRGSTAGDSIEMAFIETEIRAVVEASDDLTSRHVTLWFCADPRLPVNC